MSPSVSRLLVVLALALGLSVAAAECVPGYTKDAQGATVRYAIKQSADCSEQIVAIVGGREQVILDGDPYSFTWVELVDDFDGDGLEDALIGSQMGNCCPPSHVIVSAYPDRAPVVARFSDEWYDSWDYEDGVFTLEGPDSLTQYRYEGGRLVSVSAEVTARIPTVVAVTWDDVRAAGQTSLEPKDIDLDSDGLFEELTCYFGRSIGCDALLGDGSVIDVGFGCQRIGLAFTSTNGLADIVCDSNIVGKWTGTEYHFERETIVCPRGGTAPRDLFALAASFGSYGQDEWSELLACGATDPKDEYGQTPIFYAVAANDSAAVRAFVQYGHSPNAAADGRWTPLLMAARDATDPALVLELLEQGASALAVPQGGYRYEVLRLARANPTLRSEPVALALIAAILIEEAGYVADVNASGSVTTTPGTAPYVTPARPPAQVTALRSVAKATATGSAVGRSSDGVIDAISNDLSVDIAVEGITLSMPVILGQRRYLISAGYVAGSRATVDGEVPVDVDAVLAVLDETIEFDVYRVMRESLATQVVALGGDEVDPVVAEGLGLFSVAKLLAAKAPSYTPDGSRIGVGYRSTGSSSSMVGSAAMEGNYARVITEVTDSGFEFLATDSTTVIDSLVEAGFAATTRASEASEYTAQVRTGQLHPYQITGSSSFEMTLTLLMEEDELQVQVSVSTPLTAESQELPWSDIPAAEREAHIDRIVQLAFGRL